MLVLRDHSTCSRSTCHRLHCTCRRTRVTLPSTSAVTPAGDDEARKGCDVETAYTELILMKEASDILTLVSSMLSWCYLVLRRILPACISCRSTVVGTFETVYARLSSTISAVRCLPGGYSLLVKNPAKTSGICWGPPLYFIVDRGFTVQRTSGASTQAVSGVYTARNCLRVLLYESMRMSVRRVGSVSL